MKRIILILTLAFLASQAFAADEWLKTRPATTDQWTAWPAANVANNAALDRVLANYREGMTLSYSSATTVAVAAGEVVCSTAAGDVRKMRQNTSATNVTFSDIDTGAEEASKTYYIYANCDADATTATFKVSLSSTAPTGVTNFKRLGSFYNNASSNIQTVTNDGVNFKVGDSSSKSDATTYQALTDGVFVGMINCDGSGNNWGDIVGYSDSSSPPTTILGMASGWNVSSTFSGTSGNRMNSFSFPVKRGNYYRGVKTIGYGTPTVTYYFIPTEN